MHLFFFTVRHRDRMVDCRLIAGCWRKSLSRAIRCIANVLIALLALFWRWIFSQLGLLALD